MFFCCECCVLSGRGLCDELIAIPEESYRLWCFVVCDLETSWMSSPWPTGGCHAKNKQKNKLEQISPQVTTTTCICWMTVRIFLLENPQLSLMFFAVLLRAFLKISGHFPEILKTLLYLVFHVIVYSYRTMWCYMLQVIKKAKKKKRYTNKRCANLDTRTKKKKGRVVYKLTRYISN
jgi:hypothetical protein